MLQGRALNVTDFVREPLVVPEGTSTLRVLEQIRAHPIPLAVVVDEYGSIEGMVTANDLLATIAGDLVDTQDADYGANRIEDSVWLVDGSMSLQDLQHATGIGLPRDATYVTLSGLVLPARPHAGGRRRARRGGPPAARGIAGAAAGGQAADHTTAG